MQIWDHKIVLPSATTPWPLLPFGCVHEDDPGHHEELWAEFLDTVVKTPLCKAIGLGDYFSFSRQTYRAHIRSYTGDENSQRELDKMCEDRARAFYKTHLKNIEGKLLGLAEGNHHWTFMDGTTDTQLLCKLAKVPYLGKASGHNFHLSTSGGNIAVLQMLVHHGDWSSGAMTTGGDVNSVERKAGAWDADIYCFAHTHRKIAWKDPVFGWPKQKRGAAPLDIKERPRVYIRAGCFVRGYVRSCVTYAEAKLLKPTDLGWVTLHTKFSQPYNPGKWKTQSEKGLSRSAASHHNALRHTFTVTY